MAKRKITEGDNKNKEQKTAPETSVAPLDDPIETTDYLLSSRRVIDLSCLDGSTTRLFPHIKVSVTNPSPDALKAFVRDGDLKIISKTKN